MARYYLPPTVPPDEPAGPAEVREPAQPLSSLDENKDKAPARNATTDAWVHYAVSKGADPDDAEALTRDELIDRYGDSDG
jgi:hypothetical protein